MKVHEYQGKALLKMFGVPMPRGIYCQSPAAAEVAAVSLGGSFWVVKAQIHAGGRGKGGGVKLARSPGEVRQRAEQLLGVRLVTPQTGPEGQMVRRLWVEEGADVCAEYYVAVLTDRRMQKVAVMASSSGGMEIEDVARDDPGSIVTVWVDPLEGLSDGQAEWVAERLGVPAASRPKAAAALKGLYACYMATDASLAEINPLVLDRQGGILALDAKLTFDDNALYRQPEILAMRDLDEEDPLENEAFRHGLAYIALDGNIGCLVNGTGLAMATMDAIKLFGGQPANFLDVGGGASTEKVTEAFSIMIRNGRVKGVLVNIFGGIMKCDTIAQGIIASVCKTGLAVPLVVRMQGTNEELGKQMLRDSGLLVILADAMDEAAARIVAAVR